MRKTISLSDRLVALAAAVLLGGCVPPGAPEETGADGEETVSESLVTVEQSAPEAPGEHWPDGGAVPRMDEVDCGDIEGKNTKACYELNLSDIHFFDDGMAVAVGRNLTYYYDGVKWWEIEGFWGGYHVWGVSAHDFHVATAISIYRGSCQ